MKTYKLDEEVKILANYSGHYFEIGETVKITDVCDEGKETEHYDSVSISGERWFISIRDLS